MTITELTSLTEFDTAIKSDGLTVIKFWSKDCIPCKMVAPVYEQYSKTYKGAKYYSCDSETVVEVAAKAEVTSLPTFLLYKNGELIVTVKGEGINTRGLKREISKHQVKKVKEVTTKPKTGKVTKPAVKRKVKKVV